MAMKRLILGLCAVVLLGGLALAQGYPTRSLHLIVGYTPGGGNDLIARIVAAKLQDKLGQTVLVENKPGAQSIVAAELVAKAPPDGYTLLVAASGPMTINPAVYSKLPYAPQKDFVPISLLAHIPFVLVVPPMSPIKSVADLLAQAKAEPGKVSVGHGGNGTAMHLSAVLFGHMTGASLTQVPFKGSGPATLGVLGGNVALAVVDLPAGLPQIQAGKVVAYAVTSPQRLASLPGVPTMAEAGVPGYDSTGWFGIVAPASTPTSIVATLHAAINSALDDEAVKASIRKLGVEPVAESREAFDAYIRAETQKWGDLVKTAGIKLD
jgi:tripartite-type tricarboxylate transporter receptor subunit TctC